MKIFYFGLCFLVASLSSCGQKMDFESYNPKSTLVVPEHFIRKAKFPFVDIHNHQWGMPSQNISALLADMDSLNMRVMINLSGRGGDIFYNDYAGTTMGEGGTRNLEGALQNVQKNGKGRVLIFTNIDFSGIDNPDWSAQVVFCNINCLGNGLPGSVFSLGGGEVGGGGSLPLILDAWVEIRAQIDLDNNMYQLFYGGQLFETQQWTITNPVQFQAMDLFSNGSTESYQDLAWVDTSAPVSLQLFSVE